jgi:hypothetical protein
VTRSLLQQRDISDFIQMTAEARIIVAPSNCRGRGSQDGMEAKSCFICTDTFINKCHVLENGW